MALPLTRTALLLLHAAIVRAAFWTVTSNYQYDLTTSAYTYHYLSSVDIDVYTTTRTIEKGATPTGPALSTSTSYYSYQDIEYVSVFYPPGAVAQAQLLPETGVFDTTTDDTSTVYYMPVTFTAPASCTSSFTWATTTPVAVPSAVIDQMKPTSTKTELGSTYTYTYSTYTGNDYVTLFLTPGAVPITTSSDYYVSKYINHCEKPYSSSDYDPYDSVTVCSWYSGCTSLKTWIIIIAAIIPSLFVFGFLESWFWFRRLMTGRSALRFGTICWILISLWITCFTRKQSARSKDDQKLLREQWNKMSGWAAFKLWWKWGFRHAYPTQLLGQYSRNTVGIGPQAEGVPAGQHMYGQPMMQQQGPVMMSPPAYGNQQGATMAPPGHGSVAYYEPGKGIPNVTESHAPMHTQTPPVQVPTPSMSPPLSHSTYTNDGMPWQQGAPSDVSAPITNPHMHQYYPGPSPPPNQSPPPHHGPPPTR